MMEFEVVVKLQAKRPVDAVIVDVHCDVPRLYVRILQSPFPFTLKASSEKALDPRMSVGFIDSSFKIRNILSGKRSRYHKTPYF